MYNETRSTHGRRAFYGKRIGFLIGIAVIILAFGGGACIYIRDKYTIKTVYVQGNVHYTEEEIKAIVMKGAFGDNSLYLSLKYRDRGIRGIPFIDVLDVDILAPDTIKIVVYEKALTGYVKYLDSYLYFDKDGEVVESSGIRTLGVPQITGLEFDYVIVGERLPVKDPKVFDSILTVTMLLKKYGLAADKIYFGRSDSLTLYFGNVKVPLGNEPATLEDKLALLPGFLKTLEGKEGTLRMETYDGEGGKYVFKPD